MKSTIYWDKTPCSSLDVNRRFGETSPPSSGSNKRSKIPAWKMTCIMRKFFPGQGPIILISRLNGPQILPEVHRSHVWFAINQLTNFGWNCYERPVPKCVGWILLPFHFTQRLSHRIKVSTDFYLISQRSLQGEKRSEVLHRAWLSECSYSLRWLHEAESYFRSWSRFAPKESPYWSLFFPRWTQSTFACHFYLTSILILSSNVHFDLQSSFFPWDFPTNISFSFHLPARTTYLAKAPVTVAQRSEACTVLARSEAGIVGSNLTQGMDVLYLCLFCVYIVLCLSRGLATSWWPVQGVLPSVKWSWNWKSEARAPGACRASEKRMAKSAVSSIILLLVS
jgi:hypothetical protein